MNTIQFKDKPFLIIGRSGQEKQLTQKTVDKFNSIAINRCPFDVDIIFRYDRPKGSMSEIPKGKWFITSEEYKKYSIYQGEKFKFFKPEYKIISKELPTLGVYRFTVTVALNYIAIVKPMSEVYLVGIDHTKGKYKDPSVNRFIEQYKSLLKLYQTDFNSSGWELEYKELPQ